MKLDMYFKNIKKKYNSTVRFSKYLVMLICLVKVVVIDYNQVCSQTLVLLTIYWAFTNKKKKKII